jgi:acyl-CoA reductase-like NAD-dependent aldehyde dehydrogenase
MSSVARSVNPATEELLAEFKQHSAAEVDRTLDLSDAAFRTWREIPLRERSRLMLQAAAVLRDRKTELAKLITLEMGKPLAEAEVEIEKCAWNCEYFAHEAETFLAKEAMPGSAQKNYVAFEPLGVVLAIMPWNFPFWQVFRFAAPALMAGNTAVLKHASNVPQCATAIESVFEQSGFLSGIFRNLFLPGGSTERLISDPRIRAVTLTGSDETGASVASAAGRELRKCVLELGGSDPFIVLDDADLEQAAHVGVRARYQNAGQSCIAAKRFIVDEKVAGRFEELFASHASRLVVGDPLSRKTNMGPLARADVRGTLEGQVRRSVETGARLIVGGQSSPGRGFFFPPTVLTDVTPNMPVAIEETFGPVAAIIRVSGADSAIELANASPYGLGASIWTRDLERGARIAGRIEAGSVFINGMVSSDPRLPFGGVKRSGYGRELSSFGIREFVNIQTVCINPGDS